MKRKFWNWIKNEESGIRTLRLDGIIASDSWFDDEVTPKMFQEDLNAGSGDIVVWINSPGGDCGAAVQIYNMMMEYQGNITVKIDGIAASAASVIAMAGGTVMVSPVSQMMIHNPSTMAVGDADEMKRTAEMLKSVKESIINAYELKIGLSRSKLSSLMDSEKYMDANEAIELGFADSILYTDNQADGVPIAACSKAVMMDSMYDAIKKKVSGKVAPPPSTDTRIPADQLQKRLALISEKRSV